MSFRSHDRSACVFCGLVCACKGVLQCWTFSLWPSWRTPEHMSAPFILLFLCFPVCLPVCWQDKEELQANDLADAVHQMHQQGR